MTDVLAWLMHASAEPEPTTTLEGWWAWHLSLADTFPSPIELAIAGGFRADRLGYAFASGYQAAGAALFGAGSQGLRPTALCATENGSAHPSAMQTTLASEDGGWRLRGDKSFVTLGSFAQRLLVVASEGCGDDGRNRLRLVCIDQRDGVVVTPLGAAPFVPEIPHASVSFSDVQVADDEVLEGDGYTRYLKPFRTVEDIHVHASFLGWLLQISRRCWPEVITEEILILLVATRALAQQSPTSVPGHIALGGLMARVVDLLDRLEPRWSDTSPDVRARWERDRRLLQVASKARGKRLATAWERVKNPRPSRNGSAHSTHVRAQSPPMMAARIALSGARGS